MRDCGRGSTSWGAVTKEQRALEAAQKEMAQLPVPRSRPNPSLALCRSWTWTRTGSSTLFRLCPRQDSNLRPTLRRRVLYPLSYGGSGKKTVLHHAEVTDKTRPVLVRSGHVRQKESAHLRR